MEWLKLIAQYFKGFLTGIRAYYRAFILIYKHNLWLYFIIPFAVSAALFFSGDQILSEIQKIDFNTELSKLDFHHKLWGMEFQDFVPESRDIQVLLHALKVVFVICAFSFNKYLVLILLAPLNTLLSAKTEKILTGNIYPFEYKKFVSDIYRTINFSLRNLFRQVVTLALWYGLVSIVPVLEFLSVYVVFVVGAYYYGATLIDYNNERRGFSWEQSVSIIRKFAGVALGVGSVFSLLFFSSYFGIVFGPILGVVAATVAMHDRVGLHRKKAHAKNIKDVKKKS
jgi:CysZ protein